jgi:hypothetical protein
MTKPIKVLNNPKQTPIYNTQPKRTTFINNHGTHKRRIQYVSKIEERMRFKKEDYTKETTRRQIFFHLSTPFYISNADPLGRHLLM